MTKMVTDVFHLLPYVAVGNWSLLRIAESTQHIGFEF